MMWKAVAAVAAVGLCMTLAPAAQADGGLPPVPRGWDCKPWQNGQFACKITYPRLKATSNASKPQYAAARAMNTAIAQADAWGLDLAATPQFGSRYLGHGRWLCQGSTVLRVPS